MADLDAAPVPCLLDDAFTGEARRLADNVLASGWRIVDLPAPGGAP